MLALFRGTQRKHSRKILKTLSSSLYDYIQNEPLDAPVYSTNKIGEILKRIFFLEKGPNFNIFQLLNKQNKKPTTITKQQQQQQQQQQQKNKN